MLTRREFVTGAAALAAWGSLNRQAGAQEVQHWWRQRTPPPSPVAVVRTDDRSRGIRQAIELLEVNPVAGKAVLLIPDLESKAPYPLTTHMETLHHLSRALWNLRADSVTIGVQSPSAPTRDVLMAIGLYDRLEQIEARLLNFEELGVGEWVKVASKGGQWRESFHLAKPVTESPCVVTTGELRTKAKVDIAMSLWLGTSLLPKRDVLDRFELEQSPHPGRLIAELNQGYHPALIVLDGIEAVIDPTLPKIDRSTRVIIAGTDRVAVDAVGAAALKLFGANLGPKIFDLEQLAWSLILRVGINRPSQITLVTANQESRQFADRLNEQLANG
jgi:uncharacterized protein (DUF362 family)